MVERMFKPAFIRIRTVESSASALRIRAQARKDGAWFFLRIFLALAASLHPAALTPSFAAAASQVEFNIPAKDLAGALDEFARQANLQILFPYDAARKVQANALSGAMEPMAALELLLGESGLSIASRRGDVVTIREIKASEEIDEPAKDNATPEANDAGVDDIVVTGRISGSRLSKTEASFAVTILGIGEIARKGPASTAEIFSQIPGFWVEASGGEAANNVRSRGIPTDGYSAISLQENGVPVQYNGGLGYLNTDQSYRVDETIARLEAVRGGPASIFAPNAPGGAVNFITRRGTDEPARILKYAYGDYGYHRIDGAIVHPLTDETGILVGGFYRRDQGRRNPGFTADKGGQIRARVDYDDGANRVSLDVRHLNDRVAFFLPVPLMFDDSGSIAAAPGFDPLKDTLAGPDIARLVIKSPTGDFDFDLSEGTHVKLTAVTAETHLALASGWSAEARARYRKSDTLRNALFPAGAPTPASDYLDSVRDSVLAAYPAARDLELQYASGGAPFSENQNGNGLILSGNVLSTSVPLDERILDGRLLGRADFLGEHDLALGATFADYEFRFDRYMGTLLLDVAGQARRLDVVAVDEAGAEIGRLTDNSFLRHGSLFDAAGVEVEAAAVYFADEWRITPRLRVDYGLRWEREWISGEAAATQSVDLGDPSTLADDMALTATDDVIPFSRAFGDWGWSIGVNYQFGNKAGVFARYTDTFRLPSASEYSGEPLRNDQAPAPIKMAEIGVKYASPNYRLFVTGFYSRFERLLFTDHRFNTNINAYEERIAVAGTETLGVELEALIAPVETFDLSLLATYQDGRYRDFTFADLVEGQPVFHDYSDNRLIRVPKLALRATPAVNLFGGDARAELEIAHFTERFADISNTISLPAYTLLNINLSARVSDHVSVHGHIANLTNSLGLTEGNPRAGSFESGDPAARYFLARPEFGRTARVSLKLAF